MTKQEWAALRAAQDEEYALADAVRDEIGEELWQKLLHFNTYVAGPLDLRLIFFRAPSGKAACAFESLRRQRQDFEFYQ